MSGSIDQKHGHWLDAYLAQAIGEGPSSFLEIGCGDGLRLQRAEAHTTQCFAVESDMRQREAAAALCPYAFVVSTVDDIPPHAFDLILIAPLGDADDLETCLYKLAAKDSFKPTTTVVAMATDAAGASKAASILSRLRFEKVQIAETGPYRAEGHGSDFALFMQERYVPGTWSEIAAYEHLPRYQLACDMAKGARVLDFGCGSGYGTALLAQVASHVTGLDISEDALAYARVTHTSDNLEFIREAEFGASLPSLGFDLITCFEVIEHLDSPNQDRLLVELRRLLAPGGRLLISTPNPHTTSLYGSNPYHLCELSRNEFADKLLRHFSNLAILDQWVTASIVFQPEAAPAWARLNTLAGDEKGSQAEPAIFVGICGLESLGELSATAYIDRTRDFVRTRVQSLQWRNQQLIALYELQQARQELGRLNVSRQQAITQLHDTTAELDAVLADRAALQATYAASEAVLEESRAESGRLAREMAEFRDLTQALTAALADMEIRVKAEAAEAEAQSAKSLAQMQAALEESKAEFATAARQRAEFHDLTEELAAALAATESLSAVELAAAQAAAADLRQQVAAVTHQLMLIERSTSWRVVKLAMPLLRLARPVLRPPAAVLWRLASRLRHRPAPLIHPPVEQRLPPSSPPAQPEPDRGPPPRDLSAETSYDPVWQPAGHKYILQQDQSFFPAAQTQGMARPYVVVPIAKIDPSIHRRKILHVIPNIHVGGSTQLVVDLARHLCAELEHEVLTSSLWRDEPHEGLATHLVSHPDPRAMAEVIDRVAPDLIHVHYWGLTDDPWYHAVLDSIKGRGIPALQNVNTPIAPLIDETFRHYVFVSDYVRREFGAGLTERDDVSVIHPGIEFERFDAFDPAADREEAVGMVYRLEDDKLTETAIDVFIEIVRNRPRTKVYIIGGGRFLEPYIARTEAANVRANFRFTGYVPYATLPSWYDRFAVFIAPVWKESFGQVAPFAMAKLQAVVGFKVGALPEILGDETTLGMDIAETAAIAIALLDDPERLREVGRQNAARARAMFTVETMVSRYRDVYAKLVDLPGDDRKAPEPRVL